jgi:hypothetical protein
MARLRPGVSAVAGMLGASLLGIGTAQGAVVKLIGFETQDASEIVSLGTGASISATVRPGSGVRSLSQAATPSVLASGLTPALDTLGFRFSFRKPSNPAVAQPMVHFKNGTSNLWTLRLTTAGALDIQHNESSLSGTFNNTPLGNNTWYTVPRWEQAVCARTARFGARDRPHTPAGTAPTR